MRVTLFVSLLLLVSPAAAQDPALASARAALATYDLEGPRALGALRDLGPVIARGGSSATEARYLRAIAGSDLYTLSLALSDDALAARLADALGVAPRDLDAHLRQELTAIRIGVYRRPAAEQIELLDLANAFERGDLAATYASRGPRADALQILALSRAVTAIGGLATIPDAASGSFPADRDASAAAAAISAAFASHRRALAAAGHGDPWIALLTTRISHAMASLAATELRPRVAIPEGLVAPTDLPSGTSADVVIALELSAVSLGCAPIFRAGDGGSVAMRTVSPGGHCTGLPEVRSIPLGALPAVPRSVDVLAAALTSAELGGARSVLLAPAVGAPLHVLVRTILSLETAGVMPTHLGLRARDGTLATTPIRAAHEASLGPVDLTIHLRLGGYTVQRGRGREVSIPRIRGEHGLEFDRLGLVRALRERPPSSVAIDGMTNVAASELFEIARLASESGAGVTLVLP